MKTVAVLALLITLTYAQYFCPENEAAFQCLETKPNDAFCMTDSTWVCGKCGLKRRTCFTNNKPAPESRCGGTPKPSCP